VFEAVYNISITKDGEMRIQGKDSLNQRLMQHAGQRGIMHVTLYSDKSKHGLACYFNKYIVPRFQFYYKQEEGRSLTEEKIKQILFNKATVTSDIDHTEVYKLSYVDLCFFISEIKRFAAEDYSMFIP
jgi:hypothetical protein